MRFELWRRAGDRFFNEDGEGLAGGFFSYRLSGGNSVLPVTKDRDGKSLHDTHICLDAEGALRWPIYVPVGESFRETLMDADETVRFSHDGYFVENRRPVVPVARPQPEATVSHGVDRKFSKAHMDRRYVRTVNGAGPDEAGNVNVALPEAPALAPPPQAAPISVDVISEVVDKGKPWRGDLAFLLGVSALRDVLPKMVAPPDLLRSVIKCVATAMVNIPPEKRELEAARVLGLACVASQRDARSRDQLLYETALKAANGNPDSQKALEPIAKPDSWEWSRSVVAARSVQEKREVDLLVHRNDFEQELAAGEDPAEALAKLIRSQHLNGQAQKIPA
ncbi:MAG: hypothetical protein AAFY06_00195 [Pseudomonadota bacterium]